jgi:hypothetical protein
MNDQLKNPFHPDYGIPHSVRVLVVADLDTSTVKEVAVAHRFSTASLYRWRKALKGETHAD